MKNKYHITLIGCDDDTPFDMELTEQEAELLKRVCALSKETSEYGCMPIMTCELVGE